LRSIVLISVIGADCCCWKHGFLSWTFCGGGKPINVPLYRNLHDRIGGH
jgi:hypothetical protein